MARTFHVLIEQDEDSGYVGTVAELPGCLSQGDTLDELMTNIKEAIELYLEVQSEERPLCFNCNVQMRGAVITYKSLELEARECPKCKGKIFTEDLAMKVATQLESQR